MISPGCVKNEDELDVVPNHWYIAWKNKPEEIVEEKKVEVKEHHVPDKRSWRGDKKTEAQIEEEKRKHAEEHERQLEI